MDGCHRDARERDRQQQDLHGAADTTEVLTETHRISVRFNHPVVAVTTLALTPPTQRRITAAIRSSSTPRASITVVLEPRPAADHEHGASQPQHRIAHR